MHSYTEVHIYMYKMYVYMYACIYTYKENKLKAADISYIILYCVVFIHTQVCPVLLLYFIAVYRYYCLFDRLKVCGSASLC